MTESTIYSLIEPPRFDTTTDTIETIRSAPARVEQWAISDLDMVAAAAVEGDRPSTETLLHLLQPLIIRYCRAWLGRQERSFASADDVAQDVCLAVLTALPRYRDQSRSFLALVYDIAAQKVADVHRAAARNRTDPVSAMLDPPGSEASPEQCVTRDVLAVRMAKMRQVLPAKQWEILMLRVVIGLSTRETANAVGSTPGAVRVTQHKALARLRLTAFQWAVPGSVDTG
jgi:RNA polymerase sigma-70 factor (ECF subfamily)